MATFKPNKNTESSFLRVVKEKWASELCAEHDGTIANFNMLNTQLNDLVNYTDIFKREKWNLAKGGKIAGGTLLGASVFCPLAYLSAPGIASALGSWGAFGLAGTGTAINTLSGAALTSASLAALGPGGVAGGIFFATAVGGALGGVQGAVVSNNYFGAVKDFKITKIKEGSGPALIFINGFLSQKNQDPGDWVKAVSDKFSNNPYYYVNWESKSLYSMGSLIGRGGTGHAFKKSILTYVNKGGKSLSTKLNPLFWANTVTELIGNPWHTAMTKASMTGILLADLLARTNSPEGFILMGHSLGARVIYYLLCALSTKKVTPVKDVYLLGGAVDRKDTKSWEQALTAVRGNLFNFYSDKDSTLKFLYQGANALVSSPIGLGDIQVSDKKVLNKDVSVIVSGHMKHKEKFKELLTRL